MASGDFRVADISLADFGRKEIELAEQEVRFNNFYISINQNSLYLMNNLQLFRCLDLWLAVGNMVMFLRVQESLVPST